jgi:hypothetical protein
MQALCLESVPGNETVNRSNESKMLLTAESMRVRRLFTPLTNFEVCEIKARVSERWKFGLGTKGNDKDVCVAAAYT